MKRTVLLISVGKRKDSAVTLQKILTNWGCIIKTRLGLHGGVLEDCSEKGLLFLELCGSDEQNNELARKVAVIPAVDSELVNLDSDK